MTKWNSFSGNGHGCTINYIKKEVHQKMIQNRCYYDVLTFCGQESSEVVTVYFVYTQQPVIQCPCT